MAHHHHGRTMKSIFILLSALCAIVERGASFQTAPFHFSTPSRARNKLPYHHDKQSSLFPPPSHRKLMQQTAEAYPLSARSCECELQPIQSDSKKCHKEKVTRERFTFESMDYLFQNLSRRLRTMILSLALATILVTSVAPLALATSYGRAGGSFGGSSARSSSSRSSIRSRSSSSRIGGRTSGSSHHHHYHQPSRPYYSPSSPSPLIHIYRAAPPRPPPIVVVEQPTDVPVLVPASRQSPARTRVSVVNDVVLLTATSRLMVYGFRNNFRRRRDREDDDDDDRAVSPLGPGATFTSVTVSIDVPDRDDPNCILQRLRRVAERTDTSTRKNVQNLVSEVSLELLRQGNSIVSAATKAKHYPKVAQAEREFQRQSINDRSKYDRETVTKFGSVDRSVSRTIPIDTASVPKTTSSIVTINVAIEGDSTQLPSIGSRQDLFTALERLASDVQLEDCLLSAEILWAPEERDDYLSRDKIYEMHPNLIPL